MNSLRTLRAVSALASRRGAAKLSSASGAKVLVLAGHTKAGALQPGALASLTAASKISGSAPVTVLVVGGEGDAAAASAASAASKLSGVGRVLLAQHRALQHELAEPMANLLSRVQGAESFTHIVAAADSTAKAALPRFAAQHDVQPITDIVEVKSADTFVRPVYAGNVLCTVQSSDKLKVVTVRPTSFDKASAPAAAAAEVTATAAAAPAAGAADERTEWVREELSSSDRPELASARVVVAGGRGMKSGENFTMLYELADKMGGAVGASRAAVDAGFVPNDLQIGQTGKVVAPDLYIAVGISGAIQHLAGLKDSKTIVAINKDGEAPIFQVADHGLVADLFTAVPALTKLV